MEEQDILHDDCDPLPSGYQIPVANEQDHLAIDAAQLQSAASSVLADSPYKSAMISIAVVDDATIHEINREYLQHDYPTDVISFALNDEDDHLEGELVVSSETAITNATEYGWSAISELLLYVIHGTLHLVGYLDKDPADRAKMVAAEIAQLKKLGIALPTDQSRWQTCPNGEVPTS